jgi:hypothetical protein
MRAGSINAAKCQLSIAKTVIIELHVGYAVPICSARVNSGSIIHCIFSVATNARDQTVSHDNLPDWALKGWAYSFISCARAIQQARDGVLRFTAGCLMLDSHNFLACLSVDMISKSALGCKRTYLPSVECIL